MLDYIYDEVDDDDSTTLGRRILAANQNGPAPRAVRYRRDILAGAIDAAADRLDRPRILAVASGHLRAARGSAALQCGRIGELIAFDQDARSLAVVTREFGHLGVRTERGPVRDLIVGRHGLGSFDLIYRTLDEIEALTMAVPPPRLARTSRFEDPTRNIGFVEMVRA